MDTVGRYRILPMTTPAQIMTALAVAGAAAFLPLNSQFEEAGNLEQAVEKKARAFEKTAVATAPGADTKTGAAAAAVSAAAMERIPEGVSLAEAVRTIQELAALDGKMLSSRRIMELAAKIMALPPSHMEEARATLQEMKNPILGAALYSALFSRWGELDPEAAKTALEASSTGNPILKFAGAAALAGGWMEKNPDGFIAWISKDQEGLTPQEKKKQQELRDAMMGSVLSGMADIDSATAEKLIAASPKDRRPWLIMDMASRDPNADPREAVSRALAEAGDNSGSRSQVLWRAGDMLSRRDPLEAIKFAEEQKPEERGSIYRSAMDAWVEKDKPEAMKWLKTQPETVQADAVKGMRGEVRDMSYEDMQKFTGGLTGKASQEVWIMAVDTKSSENPQESLQYLPHLDDDHRPNGYIEIAREWTKKDPSAASEWIDGLDPGKEKDHAIQGMVRELRSKEPDSSTIWASTIGDEGTRERLVTENAKTWLKRDEAAATEWINATETISDDVRAKLLDGK